MKNIRISIGLVFAFACLTLAQSASNEDVFRRAVEAQQKGDYATAADQYRAFLLAQPADVRALSNLAVILVRLGHFDEAIANYQAAAEILPGDQRIETNLAIAFVKSGRLADAASLLEKLHLASPQDLQITLLLADCNLQLGQNQSVIKLLRPIAESGKDELAIDYVLGSALLRDNQIQEGQVLLDRILRNGDTAEARFLLGLRMFESQDFPASVKQFALAIEVNGSVPELQAYYGKALLETGDPEAAIAAFHKELSDNPNCYIANLGLAEILSARKEYNAARPFAERALLVRAASPEAMECLGVVFAGQSQWNDSLKELEAARRGGDNTRELHRTLALVYNAIGRSADATAEEASAAALSPSPGLKVGDLAPAFRLQLADSEDRIALTDYRGRSPVLLVFGSYSCPNLRSAATEIETLQKSYGTRVSFLMVYIREAHTDESWESGRNVREQIVVTQARNSMEQKDHAQMCLRKLHFTFPAVLDSLDGSTEKAFSAWPSRAVLVGIDGRVAFATGLTELDFVPGDLRSALDRVLQANPSPSQANERSH